MKGKTTALSASFNETDRAVASAAIQAQASETGAALSVSAPLNYGSRAGRTRCVREVRALERRLRVAAGRLRNWRLDLVTDAEVLPLGPLLDIKGMVASDAVRNQQASNDFLMVTVRGRLSARARIPVSSARLMLEFDAGGRRAGRKAVVHALFPGAGGRVFRGTTKLYLRPNLTFWVPKRPAGTGYTRAAEIPDAARRMTLIGPEAMNFRRLAVTGAGAGSSRVDWQFRSTGGTIGREGIILSMVVRVPRRRSRVRVRTTLEAAVAVPDVLARVLGRTRLVRDTGHWDLPVPKSAVRRRAR